MKSPLLSISIPTYNRELCLKDCLDSAVLQFEDKDVFENVEIVISDNGSTDNTEALVKKYQALYPNIKYSRNEKNIGFDRNLLLVVEQSSGEYCLTFGDDDGFFSDSFKKMLTIIRSNRAPYYMLNCWGYDRELKHPVLSRPNRKMTGDQEYQTLGHFVRSIKNYVDLVGSFGGIPVQLFKREIWAHFDKKEEFLDSQAVHLFILLQAFKDSKFVLIADPLVKTRNDNVRWDICPGFETNIKRSNATIKIALWISHLYDLHLSEKKIRFHAMRRGYIDTFKGHVKKALFKAGLRK